MPETSSSPASPVAAAPKKKREIDQRFIAPILVSVILLLGQVKYHILETFPFTLLAIGTAILAEIVLGLIYYKKVPHLASAYVTGISVGIILRTEEAWPFAVCALISILSKYVMRIDGRHLWNPSNFGISAILLLAPNVVAPLSTQFGNTFWTMIIIWALGAAILAKLKRLHICIAYVLSFLLFTAVRSAVSHQAYQTELAPLLGPPYQLFIMFMITDPKSTVKAKWAQCLVVFLIAAVECVLRLSHDVHVGGRALQLDIHAPYFALCFVGPIANFIEIKFGKKKGGGPGTPGAPVKA